MAKVLSSLPVGTLIKDTGTTYNGEPIVWKVIDKNHSGYPDNSVTLMSDKILTIKCFDAREPSSDIEDRRTDGNCRYYYSNIRSWLNSSYQSWYSAKHSYDTPPSITYVYGAQNEYDGEIGFLSGFSSNMKTCLLTTSITTGRVESDGGGYDITSDKIFLASNIEMGLSTWFQSFNHVPFSIFSSNSSRLAYPTVSCVSNSEYAHSDLQASSPWYYWLRDPMTTSADSTVSMVYSSGGASGQDAYRGWVGVRPICNVSNSILVSDGTDSIGAYTIEWNSPPTTPSSLTVPETVNGGSPLTISWGTSTDVNNNLSGYILERKYNNGASWLQIYKGINRMFTDSITFGWNSVAYRVKAYDSAGAESAYQTSATRTVNNNTPPTISGSDGNIGLKTGAFNQSYVVTDVDSGQTITVVERMDGVLKRSYTATSGQSYSFNVNATEWIKLLNGSHTMTITASDNIGGTKTRTYTFTKNETEIELTLATPLPADDLVTKAIMSVTREIPAGATFTVEVCNNGNDDSPTWEDVTNAVLGSSKFFLSNTTKTATAWGFNFRIKVKRNSATGDCFIVSVGGNFE
ncbi:DUF6273 domain-containing protein [Anaerotignum sp.]|uniref:DUF6273 domain-containing protein n=1 Tax=Anaerotignum sp. TaxID=2039241 RepID=UPI0028996401|nr:DUF6273 domain-containing protein [Anaerotignum sp.]